MIDVRGALNTAALAVASDNNLVFIGDNDDPRSRPQEGVWLEASLLPSEQLQNGRRAVTDQLVGTYQLSIYGYIGTGAGLHDITTRQVRGEFKSGASLSYNGRKVDLTSFNYSDRKDGAFFVRDISINFISDLEN